MSRVDFSPTQFNTLIRANSSSKNICFMVFVSLLSIRSYTQKGVNSHRGNVTIKKSYIAQSSLCGPLFVISARHEHLNCVHIKSVFCGCSEVDLRRVHDRHGDCVT